MPKDDQNSGHQDDRNNKPKNALIKPHNVDSGKLDGGFSNKTWHKIEGAVAKDKIQGLKQELSSGQLTDSIHKKRRRRRRKKKSGFEQNYHGSQALNKNSVHDAGKSSFPSQEFTDEGFEKPLTTKTIQDLDKKTVQSVSTKPELPQENNQDDNFHYSDEKPEEEEKVFFEDEAKPGENESNSGEPLVEQAQPEESQVPVNPFASITQNPQDYSQPYTQPQFPQQSVNPFQSHPYNQYPTHPQFQHEVQASQSPVNPFQAEVEHVEGSQSPVNPFDFAPQRQVQEDLPEPAEEAKMREAQQPQESQAPVNPFEVASSDEIYKEADLPEAPEEVPESKPINLIDEGKNSEMDAKTHVRENVIDIPSNDVEERKIEPVFPENIRDDIGAADNDFKDDLWNVLEHAGITKKKLLMIIVFILVFIGVGLFFIFGGFSMFSKQQVVSVVSKVPTVVTPIVEPVKQQPVAVAPPVKTTDIPLLVPNGDQPYDIISSFIFGLAYQPKVNVTPVVAEPINSFGDIGGVEAGFTFGEVINFRQEQFVEYVQLLEKMNNIYSVDIYSLVDLAVDRRAKLNDYLKEMDYLITQGLQDLNSIEADLVRLNTQYGAFVTQGKQYNALFFSYVQKYYGQTAFDNLQAFMDTTYESSKLKALYSAEAVLKTMFINSLNALRPKYKDVSANSEALIKGVRVFDIPSSDIKAIVPLK